MRVSLVTLLFALTFLGCSSKPGSSGTTSSGSASGTGGSSSGNTACPICTEIGLICDPTADGGCGPCASNADCQAAGDTYGNCQLADPQSGSYGTCVQCLATVACPSGEVCDLQGVADPSGVPSEGTPNICYPDCRTSSGECAAGLSYCDSTTGLCLYGCVSTASACSAADEVCDTDAGVCVGCLSGSDCPIDNPGCVAEQCGNCVQNSDCPNGQSCDVARQFCQCTASSQCGQPAPDCVVKSGVNNVDSGIAELRCGCQPDAGTCPAGTVCTPGAGPFQGGECLTNCMTDGGAYCLALGQTCNIVTGRCGPCTSDVACYGNPQGFICVTDGGLGGQCTCQIGGVGSCPTGLVCNPPLGCTPSCGQSDAGCASGTLCDSVTGACRGCLQPSDCAMNSQGTYCDNVDGGTYTCLCNSPSDCLDPDGGCSSKLHQCGLCSVAADCPASNPGCSSLTYSCGSCAIDGDCPGTGGQCDGGACGHCTDAGTCG